MKKVLIASAMTLTVLTTVTACGDSSSSSSNDSAVATTTTVSTTQEFTVHIGVDSGENKVFTVKVGDAVKLNFINDSADDIVHLHDYDIEAELTKGQTGSLSFTADTAGEFEVESHVTETVLMKLVVQQ